jgi:hypothetical protein
VSRSSAKKKRRGKEPRRGADWGEQTGESGISEAPCHGGESCRYLDIVAAPHDKTMTLASLKKAAAKSPKLMHKIRKASLAGLIAYLTPGWQRILLK